MPYPIRRESTGRRAGGKNSPTFGCIVGVLDDHRKYGRKTRFARNESLRPGNARPCAKTALLVMTQYVVS